MNLFDWNTLGILAALFVGFSVVIGLVVEGVKRTVTDAEGNRPAWFRYGVRFLIPASFGAIVGTGVVPLMLLAVGFSQDTLDVYTFRVAGLGLFLGAGAGAIANGVYQFADSIPWREVATKIVDRFTR